MYPVVQLTTKGSHTRNCSFCNFRVGFICSRRGCLLDVAQFQVGPLYKLFAFGQSQGSCFPLFPVFVRSKLAAGSSFIFTMV